MKKEQWNYKKDGVIMGKKKARKKKTLKVQRTKTVLR